MTTAIRSATRPEPQQLAGKLTRLFVPRDPRDFDDIKGGFIAGQLEDAAGKKHSICGFAHSLPPVDSELELSGKFSTHPQYGEQFKFGTIGVTRPSTIDGAVRFLCTLPGIGPVRAREIVDDLGPEAPQIIFDEPGRLATIRGIGKHAAAAAQKIAANVHRFESDRQLCNLGFGPGTREAIVAKFGRALTTILATNPYRLVVVPRVSFTAVDNAVMRAGQFPAHSPFRAAAAIVQALRDTATDIGDTWLAVDDLNDRLDKLKLAHPIPAEARAEGRALAVRHGDVQWIEGDTGLALTDLIEAEKRCAARLLEIAKTKTQPPQDWQARLSQASRDMLTVEQMEGVGNAIAGGVSVLTGGPGTGKTTATRAIIEAFRGEPTIILSPTGKAAKHAAEVTGHDASTIHRFAGAHAINDDGSQKSPPPRNIIIDESSMLSVDVLDMLLATLTRRDHRIVVIGDIDQLPSIGAGAILADCISSAAFPIVRLIAIHRQAAKSSIIANAHRINHGEMPLLAPAGKDDWLNLTAGAEEETESFAARIVHKFLAAAKHYGLDIRRDMQLLAPIRRGPIGVDALNERIRNAVNPPSEDRRELKWPGGQSRFREGDKVICIKNSYPLGVVNGDVGTVAAIRFFGEASGPDGRKLPEAVTVALDDGRNVTFSGEDISMLQQAWALTIHKSQGSEYKLVFVVVHHSNYFMLSRALVYTAVTRASERVVICGTGKGMGMAVSKNTSKLRATRLAHFLRTSATGAPAK